MEPITEALSITFLSTLSIAAMFLVMWGLMALLLKIHPSTEVSQEPETSEQADETSAMVAAAMVAIHLHKKNTDDELLNAGLPPVLVSAWQLGMRTRQMTQKSNFMTRK